MNDNLYPKDDETLAPSPVSPSESDFAQGSIPTSEPDLPQEPILPTEPAIELSAEPEPEPEQVPASEQRPAQEPIYYQPYRPQPAPGYVPPVPPYRPPYSQMPPYQAAPQQPPYRSMPQQPVQPTYSAPPEPPTPPVTKQEKKPKKNRFNWMLALLIAGCILLGAAAGALISYLVIDRDDPTTATDPTMEGSDQLMESTDPVTVEPTTPKETRPLATASGDQMTLNEIYEANVPAIVGISNESTYEMFGQETSTASTGTGFIISSDGEILTNYHVVEGADVLTVTLYDGREYPATLIGYEAESDVALIKIEATELPVCAIGSSDEVYVGSQIAAIGNPMGELTYTMTVGYVSAMDRFVNTDGTPINMMQVDAAINPGNSGGPVFNLYGEVIGIATAKYSGTISGGATVEGLGFAIPINDVLEILEDLRVNGTVLNRAYMGVTVSMLAVDKETYGTDRGVLVQSVDENGSAAKAGVQANDIILKIGDVELNAYENLQQTLRKYRAGDSTTVTVYRNGETITLPITFDVKPAATEPVTEPEPSENPEETENPWEAFPWDEFPWSEFPWGNFGG